MLNPGDLPLQSPWIIYVVALVLGVIVLINRGE